MLPISGRPGPGQGGCTHVSQTAQRAGTPPQTGLSRCYTPPDTQNTGTGRGGRQTEQKGQGSSGGGYNVDQYRRTCPCS